MTARKGGVRHKGNRTSPSCRKGGATAFLNVQAQRNSSSRMPSAIGVYGVTNEGEHMQRPSDQSLILNRHAIRAMMSCLAWVDQISQHTTSSPASPHFLQAIVLTQVPTMVQTQ